MDGHGEDNIKAASKHASRLLYIIRFIGLHCST